MIDADARRIIREFPLGVVATVCADGSAAASPKGTFLVLNDTTLAYGDIRSPGTRANLGHEPRCEVVFVDVFRRKGVRVKGKATSNPSGTAQFDGLIGQWRDVWGALADRITALVLIDVDRVRPVSTPPYDDGATEAEMIAMYRQKYATMFPDQTP
jgi:hypothetical protein